MAADPRTVWLLDEVGQELTKARAKFERFNSPHEGWAVIKEELDELWEHVKANDGDSYLAFMEAIQTAAMALRYAYDLSRISELHEGRAALEPSSWRRGSAILVPDVAPVLDIKTERDVNLINGEEFVRIFYRVTGTRRWTRIAVFPDDGQALEEVEDLAVEIAGMHWQHPNEVFRG